MPKKRDYDQELRDIGPEPYKPGFMDALKGEYAEPKKKHEKWEERRDRIVNARQAESNTKIAKALGVGVLWIGGVAAVIGLFYAIGKSLEETPEQIEARRMAQKKAEDEQRAKDETVRQQELMVNGNRAHLRQIVGKE